MGLEYPVEMRSIRDYVVRVNAGPRGLTADEIGVLDEWAARILDDIEESWPVDTSTSRDAFSYTVQGRRDRVGFTIYNDADYVQYIHRAGAPSIAEGGAPLYETLIPTMVDRHLAGLFAELRREIDTTQRRLVAERARGGGLVDIIARRFRRATPGVARGA